MPRFQNRYTTKIANADIGASDTTIQVTTLPSVSSGILVIEPRNPAKFEIISYTGTTATPSPRLTGVTRGIDGTTAQPHLNGSVVQMNVVAKHLDDLYDAFQSFSATNTDWRNLVGAATVVQQNGNRSTDMQIANDQTAILSKGMRLRIPRTVAPQTQSASLNGTNQYFNRSATINGMNQTDDIVAGTWIRLRAYPTGDGGIISRYNGTNGYILNVTNTGQIQMRGFNGGAGNQSGILSTQSIPLNKWVHIAAQLDMSAFTSTATTSYIMLDGIDVPVTGSRSGTNPTAFVQGGNLEVGSYNGGASLLPGDLAQTFVTSGKLTQATVRSIMNAGLTTALINANGVVSAFDGNGNMNDLNTTNANNLTAQNSAGYVIASPFNTNAYAIVMSDPVFSAGNTTFNVQTPEGFPIPSQTLGTVAYSGVAVPFGFPKDSSKWRIQATWRFIAATATLSAGAWGGIVGLSMTVPAYAGKLGYEIAWQFNPTPAAGADGRFSLSTSLTASNDSGLNSSAGSGASTSAIGTTSKREVPVALTTPTVYNLIFSGTNTGVGYLRGDYSDALVYWDNALL